MAMKKGHLGFILNFWNVLGIGSVAYFQPHCQLYLDKATNKPRLSPIDDSERRHPIFGKHPGTIIEKKVFFHDSTHALKLISLFFSP